MAAYRIFVGSISLLKPAMLMTGWYPCYCSSVSYELGVLQHAAAVNTASAARGVMSRTSVS